MAFGDIYRQGTATLDGSDHSHVIISGATLTTSARAGDSFELAGLQVTIDSITDDENLVLAYDFPGSVFTDHAYLIRLVAASRFSGADIGGQVIDLINKLRIFDKAVPTYTVKAFAVNTPPGGLVVGDFVVIGSAGSGAFAGHSNEIAEKTDTGYRFTIPQHGWNAISEVDNFVRVFTGSVWSSGVGLGANVVYIPGGWNSSDTFKVGNTVVHNDRLWIAATDNTNSEPAPGSTDWDLFLEVGEDGGAFTLRYQFSSAVDATTPGNGKLKFNATPASAGILRISKQDALGNIWSTLIASIGTSTTSNQKGKVRVVKRGDLTKQVIATAMSVAAITDAGGDYFNITISSPSVGTSAFADGDEVLFMFQERGDVGQTGLTGLTGATGPKGDKGDAATIAIGVITTGAAGSDADVTNSGTPGAAEFNFTIPRGDQGESFKPDHFVNDLTGRAVYDGAAEGVSVVVHSDSSHSNLPWLYAKASATSGDWTAGHLWTLEGVAAADVTYDNATSGLAATNAQDAIDEVKSITDDLTTDISDANDMAVAMAVVLG